MNLRKYFERLVGKGNNKNDHLLLNEKDNT